MMPQQIKKNFYLFIITIIFRVQLLTKILIKTKFLKINDINVLGLDNLENKKFLENLKFLKIVIYFLSIRKIFKLMDSNNIIEKY